MASDKRTAGDLLVDHFIASFEKLDEMKVSDPIAEQLATGDRDQHRLSTMATDKGGHRSSLLGPIYSTARSIPTSFRASRTLLSMGRSRPAILPTGGQSFGHLIAARAPAGSTR